MHDAALSGVVGEQVWLLEIHRSGYFLHDQIGILPEVGLNPGVPRIDYGVKGCGISILHVLLMRLAELVGQAQAFHDSLLLVGIVCGHCQAHYA